MKKIRLVALWIITMIVATGSASAQSTSFTINGRTIDSNGAAVNYASVVLLSNADSSQVAGITTDDGGNFSLKAPKGNYTLKVAFVGYNNVSMPIAVNNNVNVGNLVLAESATKIKEVVVTGQLITREADRYVMNPAGSISAIGKSADELLALAPGVWINNGKGISINGREGTRVMVNNRLLRESGEDLISYLNSIKAEDIQKIEIVPYSGADQDADMTAGIISITLKRLRNDGMNGSISMASTYTNHAGFGINPAFNINYRQGKLNLYSFINYNQNKGVFNSTVTTKYNDREKNMHSRTNAEAFRKSTPVRLGAIYELNDRHSFGVEGEFVPDMGDQKIRGSVDLQQGASNTNVVNSSREYYEGKRFSLSGNYIYRMDTVGSVFKLLFDYNRLNRENDNDFFSQYSGMQNTDSTYRNYTPTLNNIYSATANFDIVLNSSSKLSAGAKYTNNSMDNEILYEYLRNDNWNKIDNMSSLNQYTENIGALYVAYSKQFRNKIALKLGLRGEYTYSAPSTSSVVITETQQYFDLFPNANLSIPITSNGNNTLIFGYSRKISRPSFWNLNPFRRQISEYTYIMGNPRLKPSYFNEVYATYLLAKKYSFTLGYNRTNGAVNQVVSIDPDNEDIIIYRYENIQNNTNYYVDFALPVKVSKWWDLNANLTGLHIQATVNDIKKTQNSLIARLNNTFALPGKVYMEIEGRYTSKVLAGNMEVDPRFRVTARLKRSFANNRFTAAFALNNVFDKDITKVTTINSEFTDVVNSRENRRNFNISLRYNFKAGKTIKTRTIESGANEEKSRL